MNHWPILVAALLAASLPAQRRGGGMRGGVPAETTWKQLAQDFDKDRSGDITEQEFARGKDAFARLDRNGDGKLTLADLKTSNQRTQIAQRVVRNADVDENGEVTTAEWSTFVSKLGEEQDAIGEDKLAELMPARRTGRNRRGRRGRGMGEMIARMLDADGDGKVAVSEVSAMFGELDKDKNSVVKGDELRRSRRGRGNRRGGASTVPQPGDPAPDFELPHAGDESNLVKLSSFAGKKPVALIFGSYT